MLWDVYVHDVWGNAEDGYEVNDTSRHSTAIEMPDDPSDGDVLHALQECGVLIHSATDSDIETDGDDEYIEVKDAKDGYPYATLWPHRD